jgi:hypothetical protein
MNTFDKARLALREHLSQNRDKVAVDLAEMRRLSSGKSDIYSYLENLSSAFSLNMIEVKAAQYHTEAVLEDYEQFNIRDRLQQPYGAPPISEEKSKKDLGCVPRSFFLLLCDHDQPTTGRFFFQ